jgi:hypothetical protein
MEEEEMEKNKERDDAQRAAYDRVYALPRSNAEINFDLSPIESITKRFRKDQFSRVDETIAAVRELRAAIEGWLKKSSWGNDEACRELQAGGGDACLAAVDTCAVLVDTGAVLQHAQARSRLIVKSKACSRSRSNGRHDLTSGQRPELLLKSKPRRHYFLAKLGAVVLI